MTRIDRSALVMYSAQQMYALVDDIEHYPAFMQGCQAARVISRTDDEVVGELTLGKAGLRYAFTTRAVLADGGAGGRRGESLQAWQSGTAARRDGGKDSRLCRR